ncbi:hypothetical protein PWT90_06774 [Aphanocladium album]|nr:hypothetical protein PWT90_06774 [Aphanocladium album]
MRQIFGGFQVTIPTGSLDTGYAMAFMKESSTDGNVKTLADLLPRALPAFYVLAPDYIRLLLEPVLTFSKQWPESYAVHDIGKHYPNATGETPQSEEKLLLDQTSVLLWMVYAYHKISKNTQWARPYVPILKKYADYLVQNGLYPAKQRSAVDSIQATANQTVLAIYSAIGIASFGELASASNYTAKGKDFASKILDLAVNTKGNHIITHYSDPASSWIGTYPFAFDKLLDLGLFNESVYNMLSSWYETQQHPNGMQFFSEVNKTVSTLEMWLAATSSSQVRNFFIGSIHKTLTNGLNSVPGPTIWNVVGSDVGVAFMSKAKSDVGSYFMVAAVDM